MISQRNYLLLSLLCLPAVACGDDKGGTDTDTDSGVSATTGPSTGPSTGETPASSTGDASDTPGASTDVAGSSSGSDTGSPTTTSDDTSTGGSSSEGGDSTTGELLGPSWAADVFPKFVLMKCDCHTQGSGGLKMTSAMDSYMNLVGVQATGAALSRIEPGDPDASYVWHKIHGTQADVGGSGQMMPLGGPPLPQDIVDLIEEWILAGAQP